MIAQHGDRAKHVMNGEILKSHCDEFVQGFPVLLDLAIATVMWSLLKAR
jgi:hypothetical protein